jgi:hypothetical protein
MDNPNQQQNGPGIWVAAIDILTGKAAEFEREMADLQAGTGGGPGALLALRKREASVRTGLAGMLQAEPGARTP